jgi:aspartate/methionine/tyrosine aminotransferase
MDQQIYHAFCGPDRIRVFYCAIVKVLVNSPLSGSSFDLPFARERVLALRGSKIREVVNAALGKPDVLRFWFGEPDQVTPEFIRDAAKKSLDGGETFYNHNLGIPPLRQALAHYASQLHDQEISSERIAVTSSGMNALMLIMQSLIDPGDRIVAVTPVWPNILQSAIILGAQVERVPLHLDEQQRWSLNLDNFLEKLTPGTRLAVINSPNNPTGWVMPRAQMQRLLDHCRAQGIWILSDEAYERLIFTQERAAPSMLDICGPQDRVLVANTFSKSWQMTGWRLGWITGPAITIANISKLIEFNTSCAPSFVQAAGLVAVEQGEPAVAAFKERVCKGVDTLISGMRHMPRIMAGVPDGAMYVLFKVEGYPDSLALAKRLVEEAKLGLAPGAAFGDESEGFLRWCVAKDTASLQEGLSRLEGALKRFS